MFKTMPIIYEYMSVRLSVCIYVCVCVYEGMLYREGGRQVRRQVSTQISK